MKPARDRKAGEAPPSARARAVGAQGVERRPEVPRVDPGERDDARAVRELAAGDLAALGALYDAHHVAVRAFLQRATGSVADADDLAHEVFLTLTRVADRYDGRPSARPFLIGIAARLVRRRRRSVACLCRVLSMFALTSTSAAQRTPEDAASEEESRVRFERALNELSEKKRLAFLMIEGEGLSGEDAAQALGIPVATVWTRLHYAREELRAALSRRPTR